MESAANTLPSAGLVSPGGNGTQVVFPPDGRVPIDPTTLFPFQCIGELTVQFPNGAQYTGTGTLIDGFHVLTCAHLLFSEDDGGLAEQVTFAPGRNEGADNPYPYGQIAMAQGGIAIPEGYQAHPAPIPGELVPDVTQYLYDYGVVTLANEVYFDQYPRPYWADDEALEPTTCYITGYPLDKPAGTMWQGEGDVQPEDTQQFLFYQISTFDGQSGSAVMGEFPGVAFPGIVGIHVGGTLDGVLDTNFAVRLYPEVIDVINDWL